MPPNAVFFDYLELCKPKVVLLMLITALVGMILADVSTVSLVIFALAGIAACAGSAATVNHIVDRNIDIKMARTQNRPIAQGRLKLAHTIIFAVLLGGGGLAILLIYVNFLTAILSFVTLIGYAGIYTGYLKRATPQNIVIGGLAGAAPPLLGWTAATNQIDAQALILVLIIFVWTPPHFWALAIHRFEDYKNAKIPMLPVTHGIKFTKLNIIFYTFLLVIATILPYIINMSSIYYAIAALILGLVFISWVVRLYFDTTLALKVFKFSIIYLFAIFMFLLIDHSEVLCLSYLK